MKGHLSLYDERNRAETKRADYCFNCGYHLEGIPEENTCPECGVEIAALLGANVSRSLLAALRLTFWLLIAQYGLGLLMGVGLVVFAMLSGIARGAGGGTGQPSQQAITSLGLGMTVFSTLMVLLVAFGWWKVTEPIPSVPPERDALRTRNALRFLLTLSILLAAGNITRQIVGPPALPAPTQPGQSLSLWNFINPTDLALVILGFVTSTALLSMQALYLRFLSRQMPRLEGLALADVCVWLVPLLATVGVLACGMGPTAAVVLIVVLMGIQISAIKRCAQPAEQLPY